MTRKDMNRIERNQRTARMLYRRGLRRGARRYQRQHISIAIAWWDTYFARTLDEYNANQ